MGQVSDGPVLVWPPPCTRPGCRHHYGRDRDLAAEGCTCPGWYDGSGWHLIGTAAGCGSAAHIPVHKVYPLDAHESEWRCRTCGHVFMSTSGWAICPHDPDPPRPPAGARPPAHVPAPGAAGPAVDDLLARLRAWADGHAYYGPAADFLDLDAHLAAGWPYPTRWAGRAIADVPLGRFGEDLAAAEAAAPLDEALAGLHRIAAAAGVLEETWQARSVGEVCDMIAAWCRARREVRR